MSKYPYHRHDDGIVVTQPRPGEFEERPMTAGELAAREPALKIAKDIYRHANHAGVCYFEFWELIAKAIDETMARSETASREAVLEEAATVCDGIMEMNQHSAYRGARICAERIRALKNAAPQDKSPEQGAGGVRNPAASAAVTETATVDPYREGYADGLGRAAREHDAAAARHRADFDHTSALMDEAWASTFRTLSAKERQGI